MKTSVNAKASETKELNAKVENNEPKSKIETKKETYLLVSPSELTVDESLNPRTDYGEIEELMISILENGIKNPLKAYEKDGKIILKDGHRRMRAIKLALERGSKIERVPVILEQRSLNDEERTLEYIIYNDGKPLTMLEQSEVIRRLLNYGWKTTDIVKRTGKARGYIENLILLTQIPMKIQHFVNDGKISSNTVIQIVQASKGDTEKASQAVETAIKNAKESGKEKATTKHVDNELMKNHRFGKFYKWAEEIANTISGENNILNDRRSLLCELLLHFENGVDTQKMIEDFFIDKSKVKKGESTALVVINNEVAKK